MNATSKLNKRWPLVVGLTVMVALAFASPVMAAEILGDDVETVADDDVIEDDVVWAGDSLTVNGVIEGDLVAAGREIRINGTIEGDLIAVAQTVIVDGEVQDDTYAGAFLVRIDEDGVLGDELMLGAYSLEALAGSSVGDDVLFGAAQALFEGDVAGDVNGGGAGVQIDGTIDGDVRLGVGGPEDDFGFDPGLFNPDLPDTANVPPGLTVGSGASIGGDLSYTSTSEGDVASGAVAGDLDFNMEDFGDEEYDQPEFRPTRPGSFVGFVAGRSVLRFVRRFITLSLVGLLLLWLARKPLTDAVDTFKARPWASLGFGFLGYAVAIVALFIIPALLILLGILLGIISLGGLTLGVIGFGSLGWAGLLVAFLTAISWLAKIVLGLWLGQLIWNAINAESESLVPPLLIGAAIAALLTAVPVLGGLVGFAIGWFGLGAIILAARARMRPADAPTPVAA